MGRSKALVLFLFLLGSFSASSQNCPIGCRTDVRLSFSSSQHCHCPAGHATGSPCSWAGHGGTYHSPACLDTLPAGFGSGARLISIKYLRAPTLLECSFPDASGVYSLNIQRSNVSVIQPGAFRGLARAQTLSLADNRISELECDTFVGLEQLKTLRLQLNAISYLSQCAFRGLPLLRDLTLNHNSLTSVPVDSLLVPTALTNVNLNANPITTIDRQIMRLNQNPRLRLTILTIKLNCDRNLTWFICNLAILDLVLYHSSLQCVSPHNLSGTSVTTLKNGAMCSKEWENISNRTDTAITSSESPQLVPNTLPCRQTAIAKTSTETIHTSKANNHTVHTQDYTNESYTNSTPVSNQTTETDYVILFKRDPIITLDDKRTRLVTMLCAVLVPLLLVLASVIVLFFCKHCHQNYIPAEAATEDPESPEIVTPYAVAYFETIEPYAVAFAEDDSRQQTSEVNSSNQPEVGLEDAGLQTHALIHQVADQEPKILPKASIHHETSVPKPHQSNEMTDEPCPELHSQAILHNSSGPEFQARAVTNSEDQGQELHSRAEDHDDDPGPELQPYAVTYDTRQDENGMGQPYAIAYLPSPQARRRHTVAYVNQSVINEHQQLMHGICRHVSPGRPITDIIQQGDTTEHQETVVKQPVSQFDQGPELQPYAVTYDTRQGENGVGQPYAIAYLHSPQDRRRHTVSADVSPSRPITDIIQLENTAEQQETIIKQPVTQFHHEDHLANVKPKHIEVNKNNPPRDCSGHCENITTQDETFAKQPIGQSECQLLLPLDVKMMPCGNNEVALDHSSAQTDKDFAENVGNEEETMVKRPLNQSESPSLLYQTNQPFNQLECPTSLPSQTNCKQPVTQSECLSLPPQTYCKQPVTQSECPFLPSQTNTKLKHGEGEDNLQEIKDKRGLGDRAKRSRFKSGGKRSTPDVLYSTGQRRPGQTSGRSELYK